MSKKIKISKGKLSKNINSIGILIIMSCLALTFIFRDFSEIIFFSFTVISLLLVLLLSYKIRYYPDFIILDEGKIAIEYLSKSFFKQKPFSGNMQDISVYEENNNIVLKENDKIIALIKHDSISEEDQNALMNNFSTRI